METVKLKVWFGKFLKISGSFLILSLGILISFKLYNSSLEEAVYTNNYTTSILYSDSLAMSSGAAPWALMSLNWFLCRSGLKRWWRFISKRFG